MDTHNERLWEMAHCTSEHVRRTAWFSGDLKKDFFLFFVFFSHIYIFFVFVTGSRQSCWLSAIRQAGATLGGLPDTVDLEMLVAMGRSRRTWKRKFISQWGLDNADPQRRTSFVGIKLWPPKQAVWWLLRVRFSLFGWLGNKWTRQVDISTWCHIITYCSFKTHLRDFLHHWVCNGHILNGIRSICTNTLPCSYETVQDIDRSMLECFWIIIHLSRSPFCWTLDCTIVCL